MSVENLETTFDDLIRSISYIQDLDFFSVYYQIFLMKRILSKNFNEKIELMILGKFEKIYGKSFTSKATSTIKDFINSKEFNEKFQKELEKNEMCLEVNSEINLFSKSNFSVTASEIPFDYLPEELKDSFLLFEDFYSNVHSSRLINLSQNLSICEINAKYKSGEYKIIMNTIQASLINMFNKESKLKKNEIEKIFGSENLMKFIDRKLILELDDDILIVNEDFSSDSDVIDFTKETEESDFKIKNENQLKAAIVRIMKVRRKLNYQELFLEVENQVKNTFVPNKESFEYSLNDLIEKQYIERNLDDSNIFEYV